MRELLKEPIFLFSLFSVFCFVLVVGIVSYRLVKKAGVHLAELLLIIVLTSASTFILGGWYFHQRRQVEMTEAFQELEARITDPEFVRAQIQKVIRK